MKFDNLMNNWKSKPFFKNETDALRSPVLSLSSSSEVARRSLSLRFRSAKHVAGSVRRRPWQLSGPLTRPTPFNRYLNGRATRRRTQVRRLSPGVHLFDLFPVIGQARKSRDPARPPRGRLTLFAHRRFHGVRPSTRTVLRDVPTSYLNPRTVCC